MIARSTRRPRAVIVAVAAVLAAVVAMLAPATLAPSAAQAVSGSQFDAGYIVSDQNFFDYGSMDAPAVQSFLESKVPTCYAVNGQPCLRDYSTSVTSIGGDAFCSGMPAGTMSAAQIIVAAAQACRISPRVLLVMLQKEQGLITSSSPTSWSYQAALGQSCPDTAPCDSAYSGFYRQVYYGARQMRMYIDRPAWYSYQLGWNNILYNPNTGCGSKSVYIKNDATRALYIYTPYTPNQAALDNLYGGGDGCSAYGNRNFWRLWWDWFGSPTDASPIGSFDTAQAAAGGIRVTGWAIDYDTDDAVFMHVYVDGAFSEGFSASQARGDVNAVYGRGENHGFDTIVPAAAGGTHSVCIYALNVGSGSNTQLGCRTVTMFSGNPIGNLDGVVQHPGGFTVTGWAIDTDVSYPVWVHLYMDGQFLTGVYANASRGDVAAVWAGFGDAHGFAMDVAAPTGVHHICAWALNVGQGTNTLLGCADTSSGGNPVGGGLVTTAGPQQIIVSGWAVDPDSSYPIWTHVYVDGSFATGAYADQSRADLGSYAAFGTSHGFTATVPAASGWHTVCLYGINVGAGANAQLQCVQVLVGGSPVGVVDNAQPGYASVGVWGWAYDPDFVDGTGIHIYMDGSFVWGGVANVNVPVAAIPAVYGSAHGISASFYAGAGSHSVCVYALNVGTGSNTQLRCFDIAVPSANPIGSLDSAQPDGSGIDVGGWAIDADTLDPLTTHVYIDGSFAGSLRADQSRPDVANVYPGLAASGFSGRFSVLPGTHTVCVYAINVGGGTVNTQLGCRSVTTS